MMDNTNLNLTTLEIKIDKKIAKRFKYALECSQATAKVEVYKILLHFVKNSNKQSLKDVIEHLNETIRNKGSIDQYEELDTLLNFQDNEGNTCCTTQLCIINLTIYRLLCSVVQTV